MQSYGSVSSLASSSSSHSSTYGSRTILDIHGLASAPARCRSSIVAFTDQVNTLFSPPASPSKSGSSSRSASPPPPPPPPRRRRTMLPVTASRSTPKCRQLFRSCLSSVTSPLASTVQTKVTPSNPLRDQYFTQLCQHHRLLLVLNDYDCQCGCHFSMCQGQFVVLYEKETDVSSLSSSLKSKSNERRLVTVISSDLVCSKIPMEYVCDVNLLRERVRARRIQHDEQSFDL